MPENVYLVAAVIGGAVLLFQFVMMLLGLHHHGGDIGGLHHADVGGGLHDGDFSGGHDSGWHHDNAPDGGTGVGHWFYEIISIRTLGAAAAFFGMTGATARAWGYSPTGSFVMAAVAGAGAMYGVYWLYKQVFKLQHTGTENIRNAIGAPAVVYIPVPAKRNGAGKVTFKLQNRLVEYLAVTDDDRRLATGEKVVIEAIISSDTVRVRQLAPTPEAEVSSSMAV